MKRRCPSICPEYYSPICASNGKTYGNVCIFRVAVCKDPSIKFVKRGTCADSKYYVAHKCQGKTLFLKAKLSFSRQNFLSQGKTFFLKAKLSFSRQNFLSQGKTFFLKAKLFSRGKAFFPKTKLFQEGIKKKPIQC